MNMPFTRQPRPKLWGVPLIVGGVVVTVIGFVPLVANSQQYDLCNGGLGNLAQAFNASTQTNCQADDIGHNVCIILLVLGLALIVWGFIRMFWKRDQQASQQAASWGPPPPGNWQGINPPRKLPAAKALHGDRMG